MDKARYSPIPALHKVKRPSAISLPLKTMAKHPLGQAWPLSTTDGLGQRTHFLSLILKHCLVVKHQLKDCSLGHTPPCGMCEARESVCVHNYYTSQHFTNIKEGANLAQQG